MRINKIVGRKYDGSKDPSRRYEGPLDPNQTYSFEPDDRDEAIDVTRMHENWQFNVPTISERARITNMRDMTPNARESLRIVNKAKRKEFRRN